MLHANLLCAGEHKALLEQLNIGEALPWHPREWVKTYSRAR